MIKITIKTFFAVAIILSISACSGGSSSDSADTQSQQGIIDTEQNNEVIIQQNQPETEQADPELPDLQEYNQNIIISIVDSEGNPFADTFVQWKIADSIATEMVDAVCIDDNCTTWVIDQFPSELIYIRAVKLTEQESDPMCSDVFEGEWYVDASIQELQEVDIIIEQTPEICEQS